MACAFDLAILGSGFGGSLLAMAARRLGLRVLLLDRGSHPRFAIGESTSPLSNLLLEELARRCDLPRLLPLAAYGTWRRAYPELPVGLKRGFSFYHHEAGRLPAPDPQREGQLLVAASPADAVADTHWYRAALDEFLVQEAQALGVEYLDRVEIEGVERAGDVTTLRGRRAGRSVSFAARFVVDATGPRGALSRLLGLPEQPFPGLPATRALYSHFTGAGRYWDVAPPDGAPPYPPDDAALHHVFAGGWMWVLRFENGVTSAGFAVEEALAAELRLEEGAPAWERFLRRFPGIRAQLGEAEPVLPFTHAARLPYRCAAVAGEGWALLPSAAAFVDPLFSTGFPLTLLGIHRLVDALEQAWGTPEFAARLAAYARVTAREAAATARLVGACYRTFGQFPAFAALSMLYFTAASYAEMARRLGRPHLAGEFLLQGRPEFRSAFRRHLAAARAGRPSTLEAVGADLERFNIAGLCDPGKRGWYGVDLGDVVRGAGKLEATPEEVEAWIREMGW